MDEGIPPSSPPIEDVQDTANNIVESLAKNMESSLIEPSDNQFFFEDEVFRIDKNNRFKFGMIIETFDSYDEDEVEILRKGQVRVAWYPGCKEEALSERDIGLVDRTLMPGDIVRRLVPGRSTQRGYVLDVKVRADVRVLNSPYMIRNVKTERLSSVMSFPRDAIVCLDSWVGTTKITEERVILSTLYGARIEVPQQVFWAFEDYESRNLHGIYEPVIMFPGNILVGRLPSLDSVKLLTPDRPLRKSRRGRPLTERYTVESVTVDSAWINWQCKALSDDKDVLEQPDPLIIGEDLKRLKYLNFFEACMQQISDRNFLVFDETDQLIKKSEWDKEQAEKYKSIYEQQQSDEHQRLFINAGGATSVTNSTPNHFGHDKLKKKLSQLEGDKNAAKAKRLSFHIVTTDTNAVNMSKSTTKDSDNSSWLTEEECELEEDGVDLDEDTDFELDDLDDAESDYSTLNAGADSDAASGSGSNGSSTYVKAHKHNNSSLIQHAWRRNFIKRSLKKLRKFAKKSAPNSKLEQINAGDKIATETLLVYSKVTVKWQDGTIEEDIDSTELYPIHHLDHNELFPGDFVISAKAAEDVTFNNYGVIQKADHLGRTATVKWFTTYTNPDLPIPKYNGETEESVYDLTDHPDFVYRAGTMVIRVANFAGENSKSTAGQIVDCEPTTGQVKVRWVDGHVSFDWPQDLFEVLNHVHNDNSNESDDSWETASTRSESSQKLNVESSHIISNIERARVAIERLAELFHINPSLQNIDVLRKLLSVYKCCRYLDRLLNTNFFHENNFQGLIERVRLYQNVTAVAQERKNRLFNEPKSPTIKLLEQKDCLEENTTTLMPLEMVHNSDVEMCAETNTDDKLEELQNSLNAEKTQLLSIAIINMERAFEKTSFLRAIGNSKKEVHDDSGNYCDNSNERTENSKAEINESKNNQNTTNAITNLENDGASECILVRFCCLLKEQIAKCIEGIREKYFYEEDIFIEDNEITIRVFDGNKSDSEDKKVAVAVPLDEKESIDTITNIIDVTNTCPDSFQILPNAPKSHKFYLSIFQAAKPAEFHKAVAREHRILARDLPAGVWVRAYEDRMDLLSIMIAGPKYTPYEGGLYLFDLQLSSNYPSSPPACHYLSFCSNRLNPNLYEDGKVCVSLLGTWTGHGSEIWGSNSSLLQLIVSIQGLILVVEPYYNEAGYAKQKGTQQGNENSRMYNEMVVIKMVQATIKLLDSPPEIFREEIINFYKKEGMSMFERIKGWMELSQLYDGAMPEHFAKNAPEFSLIPGSRGFCRTLQGLLAALEKKLSSMEFSLNTTEPDC